MSINTWLLNLRCADSLMLCAVWMTAIVNGARGWSRWRGGHIDSWRHNSAINNSQRQPVMSTVRWCSHIEFDSTPWHCRHYTWLIGQGSSSLSNERLSPWRAKLYRVDCLLFVFTTETRLRFISSKQSMPWHASALSDLWPWSQHHLTASVLIRVGKKLF